MSCGRKSVTATLGISRNTSAQSIFRHFSENRISRKFARIVSGCNSVREVPAEPLLRDADEYIHPFPGNRFAENAVPIVSACKSVSRLPAEPVSRGGQPFDNEAKRYTSGIEICTRHMLFSLIVNLLSATGHDFTLT